MELRRLLGVAAALLAASLSGCGYFIYHAEAIEGWVVDAGTGRPIEGVIVVAHWELEGGFEGGVPIDELQIYETVTDERGRYHFPKWGPKLALFGKLESRSPRILLFKPGYGYGELENDWHTGMDTTKSDWNGKTVKLKKFEGPLAQYAQHLAWTDTLWRMGFDIGDYAGDYCGWRSFPRILRALDELEHEFRAAGINNPTAVSTFKANDRFLKAKGCGSVFDVLEDRG